ncbi:MAG: DUF4476 domain-containing protein [Bacteroidetes bacterium]|nr:DUF4476 domain-containing protein [Bacteroidota bacterium]
MKKYLIVLISILIWCSANAQKSNLIFFTEKGEAFTLFLNGVKQNKTPQTNVRTVNLTQQNYHAKVVFKNRHFGQVSKNIFFNKGKETSYVIKRNKNGTYAFIFRGETPVSRNSECATARSNSKSSNASASRGNSRNSRASASGRNSRNSASSSARSSSSRNSALPSSSSSTIHYGETTRSSSSGERGNVNSVNNVSGNEANCNAKARKVSNENSPRASSKVSRGNNEVDFNLKVNDDNVATKEAPSDKISYTTTTTTTTTTSTNSGNSNTTEDSNERKYETNYNDEPKCDSPMKQSDFISAKKTISSKSFEESKLKIAKQITASNCLLASQIKEIMRIFEFENTRLKYAKYSYEYTYDVGNYFKVNDAFEYESSIDKLDEFINSQK